jgi:hypothetical protein
LALFCNTSKESADLLDMLTLLLLFALQAVTPGEMACSDSVKESAIPMALYIAGVEQEGAMVFAAHDQILYINGQGVSSLKPGAVLNVIRPEGKVQDPITGAKMGYYYKDIGTVQIEAVQKDSATARVLVSCREMLKGDLVTVNSPKPPTKFDGDLSTKLTLIPQNGLIGSIILGKDDIRQMAAGNICYIGLGKRDGVVAGDRFTVFRPNPKFNPNDMVAAKSEANRSYAQMRDWQYQYRLDELMRLRALPPVILGDILVVDTGEGISTGKIINSLMEIHTGDFIVKR